MPRMMSQNSEGCTAGFGKDCLTWGVASANRSAQHADRAGHKETKCSGFSTSALHSLHEESPGSAP